MTSILQPQGLNHMYISCSVFAHSSTNWTLLYCVQQLYTFIHTRSTGTGRGAARAPRQVTLNGIIYSDKVKSLADLRDDEDAAAAEALAQGGRPGYCGDRYFKAAAGGHMCDHFDRHS